MRRIFASCALLALPGLGCDPSPDPAPPVDSARPALRIAWQQAPTATSSPEVTFAWALTADNNPIPAATWSCSIDQQPAASCTPPLTIRVAGEGAHTLAVSAMVDPAYVAPPPVTTTWRLDTTAPVLAWEAAPPALTTATDLALSVSASEPGEFVCALDDKPLSCGQQISLGDLGLGDHLLRVEFCDPAGNCAALTTTFRVDAPPETSLTGCPSGLSSASSVLFTLSGSDNGTIVGWRCLLDGGGWFDCGANVQLTGLGTGTHQFSAMAVDDVGLTDGTPSNCSWTIDLPPETWLVYRPSPQTPLTTAVIEVTSPDTDLAGFTCASADGTASCPARSLWTAAPAASSSVTVTAIDSAGLADPSTSDTTVSWTVETSAVTTWTASSVGETHACALRADSSLWCWGANESGQLGVSSAALPATSLPLAVTVASAWTTAAAGHHHTCAITATGSLWCWGLNVFGEVGTGTTGTEIAPTQLPGSWRGICANRWHSCGIDSADTAWCWGYNPDGRLGTGDTANYAAPVSIAPGTTWQQMSCGGSHTCGLATDGSVLCWGSNGDGQVAGTGSALTPRPVALPATATAVAAGGRHSCALLSEGSVYCWGNGESGQRGTAPGSVTMPARYGFGGSAATLATGGLHTCLIDSTGALFCSGEPLSGALGFRPLPPSGGLPLASVTTPTQTGSESAWRGIAAGNTASCGIRDAGTLWCWGQGDLLPAWAGEAGFSPVWIRATP